MNSISKNSKDTLAHCLLLGAIAIGLCIPALWVHFPDSQDGIFALMAFQSFSEQFYAGEWYPRWLYDFYNGHGAPMFYYYPPFLFYLEVLIDTLTLRSLPDLLIIGLTGTVLRISAALACYIWIRNLFGAQKAFLAALIYVALPNHLIFDLYYKGTLTELSAYTWLPLILFFARRSFFDHKAIVFLALSYTLLITSSVPMALAFSPFFLIYIGYEYYFQNQKLQNILRPLSGFILGFGLAGFHIITAYLMTDYIGADKFWSDFYNPRNWFICTWECDHSPYQFMSFKISNVLWLQFFAIIAMSVWVFKNARSSDEKIPTLFWFVIAIGTMFMMSEVSLWFWDHVPLLERIQFPWRLAVALELAFVFFIARLFPEILEHKKALNIGVLCVLASFILHSINTGILFSKRGLLYDQETFAEMVETKNYFGVYLPNFTTIDKVNLLEHEGPFAKIGDDTFTDFEKIPYGYRFSMSTWQKDSMQIRQLYFPSWRAFSQKTKEPYALSFDDKNGSILIDLKGKADTIILKHTMTKEEQIGWIISIISSLALFSLFLIKRKQDKGAVLRSERDS